MANVANPPGAAGPQDAAQLVVDAAQRYIDKGDMWIAQVNTTLGDLSNLQIQPQPITVNYNLAGILPNFVRPTAPATPAFGAIVANTPSEPDLDDVALRTLGDAPDEPDFSHLPQYAPPAPPNSAAPVAPADVAVVLDPIIVPDRPTYDTPERPALFDITLPVFQPITIPEFTGQRPVFDLQMPDDGQLAYADIAYVPVIQAEMKVALLAMIQGGTGLPVSVERAIFDRGRAREDMLSRKLVQETAEDMAARGLTEPNGILGRKLKEARQANRDAVHGLNRDLTIQTAQMAVDGMKFAVTQGMALEAMLIQQNQALNDRALRIALAARDYSVARLNALIGYANLQQQAYATDAQIWHEQITAALSRLEIDKAEIDKQRLIGEINKDLIARYESEFRGIAALADFYKSDVEAASTRAQINVQRLDAAKLIIDTFATKVQGWVGLQTGYRAQVDGALGTVQYAEALANVFNTRMNGYKTKGEAYFEEGRFGIERNAQRLERFRTQLAASDQDLRAQVATLDAQVRVFGAETGLFEAQGNVSQAESAALDRTTSLRIENERNRVTIALEAAKANVDQILKIGEIYIEQLKAKAATLGQLVASSQSAVSYQAGISEHFGQSLSYSKSFGYSGDTDDAQPTF